MALPVVVNDKVLMWAETQDVEPQAMGLIHDVTKLPWIHGMRVMADVHLGVGAVIGSVIAMPNAICPAAVGVDIGCVDAETEYLSPLGWRRIDEYEGGQVMQYDKDTDMASFVQPVQYVVRPQGYFYHFKTRYGIDQMLTPDHRVLRLKITGRGRRRVAEVISAADWKAEHDRLVQGSKSEILTTAGGYLLGRGIDVSDADLRVHVMVCADATIDGSKAVVKFRKQRKINRAIQLLNEAGIEYTTNTWRDDTSIRFTPPFIVKSMTGLWHCSVDQLKLIADEVLHWDGNAKDEVFYTRNKEFADLVSYAFMVAGYRSVMRDDERDGVLDYRVYRHLNKRVGLAGSPKSKVEMVKSSDGKAYCFTVPTGFLILRRNGNVFITGNCGMGAIKTNLKASDLPESLRQLRLDIEAAIPVGHLGHEDEVRLRQHGPVPASVKRLWDGFKNVNADVKSIEGKARLQLGTLGGGNHFVEVCLDTDDNVWVMLHSGSRNIGKVIAEKHINTAKLMQHNIDLGVRDLAVFLTGSPECEAYRHDVMWAQDFAFNNRAVMIELVKGVVSKHFPQVKYDDPILCHHNYISEEIVDGEKMFITRKGAISAKAGEMGIIPGSMGTRSYIVKGLGNPASYQSASHGAGRVMSRTAAKKLYNVEDVEAATAGVECRKDAGVIDEIPMAYKDIDAVIASQSDLVSVEATLKQILCVKG